MKHLIYKSAAFFLIVGVLIISYLSKSTSEINTNTFTAATAIPDSQFIVGAFDNGYAVNRKLLIDSLHFNMWHQYTGIDTGWNRNTSDNYLAPTGQYSSLVNGILQVNKDSSLRTLMDRPTMQYIIGGQRCDYQCEKVDSSDPYWFYAYKYSDTNYIKGLFDITDNSRFGTYENNSRAKVKYCQKNSYNENQVYVIDSGLIAYRELSFNGGNYWTNDNRWDWYLMPRIRIDSAYAVGETHNSDTICKISIRSYKDSVIKDVFLTVRNFKVNTAAEYNGNYIDTFYYETGQTDLTIDTNLLKYFTPPDVSINSWDIPYYTDFHIYWYGKCDMWIDRVRLENEPAHQYLTLNDQTHQNLINKVATEVDWAVAQPNSIPNIPNYFYFEECEFSHFPCISALNKQIRDNSFNQSALIIWLNYDLFNLHRPDCWSVYMTPAQWSPCWCLSTASPTRIYNYKQLVTSAKAD
ncbi:MAG TPA: hypothetical protein VIL99_08480 [Ignavibacteria bacterium]